jgi:hypothetical protein
VHSLTPISLSPSFLPKVLSRSEIPPSEWHDPASSKSGGTTPQTASNILLGSHKPSSHIFHGLVGPLSLAISPGMVDRRSILCSAKRRHTCFSGMAGEPRVPIRHNASKRAKTPNYFGKARQQPQRLRLRLDGMGRGWGYWHSDQNPCRGWGCNHPRPIPTASTGRGWGYWHTWYRNWPVDIGAGWDRHNSGPAMGGPKFD